MHILINEESITTTIGIGVVVWYHTIPYLPYVATEAPFEVGESMVTTIHAPRFAGEMALDYDSFLFIRIYAMHVMHACTYGSSKLSLYLSKYSPPGIHFCAAFWLRRC
jgi:hypothetical protein